MTMPTQPDYQTTSTGLTAGEVEHRLNQYGPNLLPQRKPVTVGQILLRQFLSPLIYVLLLAALLSLFLGDYTDAGFIGVVLLINALIGAFQEWRAESNADALQKLIKIRVRVRRDNAERVVPTEELVPGDLVLLESGNKIPADIRLLVANQITVEEAILTGESMPVIKRLPAEGNERTDSSGDRADTLFAGTTMLTGRATGVVIATGTATEIGKIAESLHILESTKAPLVERMEVFAQKLSLYALIACGFIVGVGYVRGMALSELFFLAVAVAVSAIPEGLPIAMTVALSIGTQRMARRNVIVRRLTAVEGLGSCTVVATDKTGTLTMDQQTVKQVVLPTGETFRVTGEGYNGTGLITTDQERPLHPTDSQRLNELIEAVTICNESNLTHERGKWRHRGDAVDVALLALAYKSGSSPDAVTAHSVRIDQIPFESERKFAGVYYQKNGVLRLALKGALEVILPHVDPALTAPVTQQHEQLAARGFRVIAVAAGPVSVVDKTTIPPVTLLGLVALIDPLRPEAQQAVQACRQAGVGVVMITGDHPTTAFGIGAELGIVASPQSVITGDVLADVAANQSHQELLDTIRAKQIFARVSPRQKQEIVDALREDGNFVAVTGDGVNDAPALKTANIGIAMGYGTDVAKETASIIVTDNNFASIVAGIEEGRVTYSNLRKIIYMAVSTGAAEILLVVLSMVAGLPIPLLPVQLLWLNLVTNGIQDVSLAFEKGESGQMRQRPRNPAEGIFDPMMVRQTLLAGGAMTATTFGLWYHLLNNLGYGEFEARNIVLLLMVLIQNVHVFNCRSETASVFTIPLRNNYVLVVGIFVLQVLHVGAMQIPFMQDILRIAPVTLSDWLKLVPTAAIMVLVMEVFKWATRRAGLPEAGDETQAER